MKIAIVEDDINMRKSLEIAMGDYPEFEVVSFKSARDALKKLERFELVTREGDVLQCRPLAEAKRRLDHIWDNYFRFNHS